MKTYTEFTNDVKKNIRDYLPEEFKNAEIYVEQVTKNNNQKMDSLTIHKEGDKVVPILYLQNFYQHYQNTGSFENTLKNMAEIFLDNQKAETDIKAVHDIHEFEKIKDRILLQVINMENNQEMLSNIPHRKIEGTDLAAIFRILFYDDENQIGTTTINRKILSNWDVDMESLYKIALENTQSKNPFTIHSMQDIIIQMMEKRPIEESGIEEIEEGQMYVLSTERGVNGAVTLLYPQLMEQIAERFHGNYYILPSSLHELILIKDNGEFDAKELQQMVMEINLTQVEPQEVLSNQVFLYRQREHSLTMATSPEQTRELMEQMRNQLQFQGMGEDWEEVCER